MSVNLSTGIGALVSNFNTQYVDSIKHYETLQTGKRINSAKDDAAGLITSIKNQSQISGNGIAIQNLMNARGILSSRIAIQDSLIESFNQFRELVLTTQNIALGPAEISNLDWHFNSIKTQAREMADISVEVMGTSVAIGHWNSQNKTINIQSGSGSQDNYTYELKNLWTDIQRLTPPSAYVNETPQRALALSLREIDTWAMPNVINARSNDAAMINSIERQISALSSRNIALSSSNSRILDTDYTREIAAYQANEVRKQISASAIKKGVRSYDYILKLLR